jgi:hypothetical protein
MSEEIAKRLSGLRRVAAARHQRGLRYDVIDIPGAVGVGLPSLCSVGWAHSLLGWSG